MNLHVKKGGSVPYNSNNNTPQNSLYVKYVDSRNAHTVTAPERTYTNCVGSQKSEFRKINDGSDSGIPDAIMFKL